MLGRMLKRLVPGKTASDAQRGLQRFGSNDTRPELSIIICSVDEQRFAAALAHWRQKLAGRDWELIRIADAKSLSEGYNRGLDASRGEHLVFCHDDVEALQDDAAERILRHLRAADVVGVAGASRLVEGNWMGAGQPDIHGQVLQPAPEGGFHLDVFGLAEQAAGKAIAAVDGLFMAARRSAANRVRFDAQQFDGFHLYDLDFSYRAHLDGMQLAIAHDLLLYHHSTGRRDAAWEHYRDAFQRKFGNSLSREPAGEPRFMRHAVRDRAHALAVFRSICPPRA